MKNDVLASKLGKVAVLPMSRAADILAGNETGLALLGSTTTSAP